VTARRGRRRKQLLHNLKGKRYCNFEEQALYCTLKQRALAGAKHTPRDRLRNEQIHDITHDLLLVTNLGTLAMK
jgi:hypothetical protein